MKVGELRNALKDVDGDIEVVVNNVENNVAITSPTIDAYCINGIINGSWKGEFVIGYEKSVQNA